MKKGVSARRWLVSGRVQGVGFRYFVQHTATSLGVRGWARNLDDGRVEVFGMGSEASLNELAGALHKGPRMSQVRGIEEHQETPQDFSSFSIR